MSKHLTSTFRPRLSEERGVALILTLAIIALVTLLLIAFVTSMRVENAASKNFNDLVKTRELALGAVDQAVATIRQATAERTASPVYTYTTSAGNIYQNTAGTIASLSLVSPKNPTYPLALAVTNLNDSFWITGSNTVEYSDATSSAIPIGWVYVLQDPSSAPGPGNPVIGRYAYWADDEASKININTASQRPATSPDPIGYSTNSEIDLSVLLPSLNTPVNIAAIQARQASTGPGFTTIEEVKLADLSGNTFTIFTNFNMNRFYLTTYSNDGNYPNYTDDLDVFGRQRLNVSNLQDPGDINGSGGGGVSNALVRMSDGALKQVYSSTGAFDTKYSGNQLKQIIANIIAYQINPATQWPPDDGAATPGYLGLAAVPYINEVNVQYDFGGTSPNFNVTRTVKVELIYQYNTNFTAQAGDTITVFGLDPLTPIGLSPTVNIDVSGASIPAAITGAPNYKVVSRLPPETAVAIPTGGGPTALPSPSLTVIYTRNYAGTPHRLNYAQMKIGAENVVTIPGSINDGAEVNDPAVNISSAQWHPYKNGHDTLGGGAGAQNSAGAYAPLESPPSKTVIRTAPMKSIGELGYIHRPEPWKYLTLQPGGGIVNPGDIPDWAILDMFTIPGLTAGRININSTVAPLSTDRLVPLKALLNNVIASGQRDTVSSNIYNGTYVTSDTFGNPNAYDTIGEICEVKGMDNGAALEADKEAAIRRIANLITVRSSAFTIWVMAQSIKQPPSNPTIGTYNPTFDLITGEVRAQAVVERYESAPGAAGSVPKFRTRYFRYLYN